MGIVAKPRINRAVNKLGGNTEQKHARQYGNQGKHPRQPTRNLRTEHAFAVVAHQKHDIAHQHCGQHQQQQAAQGDNPPEIIGQYVAAARCNSQAVQQNYGEYGGNQEKAAHGLLLHDRQGFPTRIQMPIFRSQGIDLERFGQLGGCQQQADFSLRVFGGHFTQRAFG